MTILRFEDEAEPSDYFSLSPVEINLDLGKDSALSIEISRLVRELAAERLALPSSEDVDRATLRAAHERYFSALSRVVTDLLNGTSADREIAERVGYFAGASMALLSVFAHLLDNEDLSKVALQIAAQALEKGGEGLL
jgi:hypothetical protein